VWPTHDLEKAETGRGTEQGSAAHETMLGSVPALGRAGAPKGDSAPRADEKGGRGQPHDRWEQEETAHARGRPRQDRDAISHQGQQGQDAHHGQMRHSNLNHNRCQLEYNVRLNYT